MNAPISSTVNCSQSLNQVIGELLSVGSISKDHFYVHALEMEGKYELIRMESLNLLTIAQGKIRANDTLYEWADNLLRKTG